MTSHDRRLRDLEAAWERPTPKGKVYDLSFLSPQAMYDVDQTLARVQAGGWEALLPGERARLEALLARADELEARR